MIVYLDRTYQHGLVATKADVLTTILSTNGYLDPADITTLTLYGLSKRGMYGGYQNTVGSIGVLGAMGNNDSGSVPGGALDYAVNYTGIVNNVFCGTDYELTENVNYWSSTSATPTFPLIPPAYQNVLQTNSATSCTLTDFDAAFTTISALTEAQYVRLVRQF